ncbi:Trimethylguanosine synthase [Linderina macrospora]|uniref:Trimethylguanosine synthase n=1 Tax=Linderina macrospora TaxID=4868 RepID=A0ACC1J2Z0_9FUNG|nr:Trimethylguanosine synthase [Linderina macrospora]
MPRKRRNRAEGADLRSESSKRIKLVVGKTQSQSQSQPHGPQPEETARGAPAAGRMPNKLRKYWDQRFDYFSRFDEGIQIDNEGWYSVTPEAIAEHTARRIAQLHNDHSSKEEGYGRICVVDAFCGVGGNTIKFAEWCEHVIAIDVDAGRLAMARNNAEVYGVADRIEFVLGDFYELAPTLKADVVFLSPPWGGPEYQKARVFDLDSLPIRTGQQWVDRARLISDNVVCFLPRNCRPEDLAALAPTLPCDIEMNRINGFLKAVSVYFGQVATFGSIDPRPAGF